MHHALNVILQFLLFALAQAAPLVAEGHHRGGVQNWQFGVGGGVVGFIILILDIIVFIEVLQSTRPVLHKLLWCLLVFFFPIGGMIIYWLFSNRSAHRRGYEVIG